MEDRVADIILALTKALKALQLYGTNHPSFKHFYTPLYKMISEFLNNAHELNFQIERSTLLYDSKIVYKEEEKDLSIAFRLFRDGIRNIGFVDGLTSEELLKFLEVIGQFTKDQDITLGLWEGNFVHLNFHIVEEDDEQVEYKVPEEPVTHIDYVTEIGEMIKREKIDLNELIIAELNLDELKTLKAEIAHDEKKSAVPLAITTLIDFLNIEKSQEVIDSLIRLLEQCINTRDFLDARKIVHNLLKIANLNVIERFENEATILGFKDLAEIPENEIFNEFMAFLGYFSRRSIPFLMKVITVFKRPERLEALRHRIASIVQNDTKPIAAFLNSKDSLSVINAIAILGVMKAKEASSLMQPLIVHDDPKVRAEVISTLKNLDDPQMIAKFIDDQNLNVRIHALHMLTQMKYPKIYFELLGRVESKEFFDREAVEQREYFNCMVENRDSNFVPILKKILFKWQLFGRKKYRVMRKLAANALLQINTNETLEILREGANKKDKEIKSACETALKGK